MKKELPHIGQMLRAYVKKHRIYQSAWSREIGVTENTIATYLKNRTIRLDTLYNISQSLEHNFIREIADTLPDNLPPVKTVDLSEKVVELEQKIATLTTEVATLKEVIRLLGGK